MVGKSNSSVRSTLPGYSRSICSWISMSLRELAQLRIELAIGEILLQQMALDLAAGGLRDALHRYDLGHLEPGLLVDEPRDLPGERQEVLERATVQHEHHQLLDLRPARAYPGSDDLAEL